MNKRVVISRAKKYKDMHTILMHRSVKKKNHKEDIDRSYRVCWNGWSRVQIRKFVLYWGYPDLHHIVAKWLHDRAFGYFYSQIDFFKNPNGFSISILDQFNPLNLMKNRQQIRSHVCVQVNVNMNSMAKCYE